MRRTFIKSLALAALTPVVTELKAEQKVDRVASCQSDWDGRHFLAISDSDGITQFRTELPGRGHALVRHPVRDEVVVFARRPGEFLWVVDLNTGEVKHRRQSMEGRHFYGHGVFDRSGTRIYVTENAYDEEKGVIGVYASDRDYQKVAEYDSHGIGPHELALLSDDKTLVIANGGILTHPNTGRSKLNLDTMRPSLVYLDASDGRLIESVALQSSDFQNSIRHLVVGLDDRVWFAMQFQGSKRRHPNLLGVHSMGKASITFRAPDQTQLKMKNYCGSVCLDPSGELVAVSSPKGNLITLWAARDGKFLQEVEIADGCGITPGDHAGSFYLSSGQGDLYRYQFGKPGGEQLIRLSQSSFRWDNHMTKI